MLSNSGYTVALNAVQYSSSWCGKTITISANGKSHSATIQDECPGDGETCKYGALDMSPALFNYFADPSVGVIDISWSLGGAVESVVSSLTGGNKNDDDDDDSSSNKKQTTSNQDNNDDEEAKKKAAAASQAAASKAAAQASRSSASAAAYASSTAAAAASASRASVSSAAYASSTHAAAISSSKASVAAEKCECDPDRHSCFHADTLTPRPWPHSGIPRQRRICVSSISGKCPSKSCFRCFRFEGVSLVCLSRLGRLCLSCFCVIRGKHLNTFEQAVRRGHKQSTHAERHSGHESQRPSKSSISYFHSSWAAEASTYLLLLLTVCSRLPSWLATSLRCPLFANTPADHLILLLSPHPQSASKSSVSVAAASASAEAARPKNLENFDALFGGLQQLAMAAQS